VNRGSSLVEVVVSILIAATVAMGVFSVALTGRQSRARVVSRESAAFAQRKLLSELQNYVTADLTSVAGPGGAPNGWGLPGDSCNCWALSPGVHNLDAAVWLPSLAGAPHDGAMSYTVTTQSTAMGALPTVTASIQWTNL
jgi:hypothetical protein